MPKHPIQHQDIFICTVSNRTFLVCTQNFLPSLKVYTGPKPFPETGSLSEISESKNVLMIDFRRVAQNSSRKNW